MSSPEETHNTARLNAQFYGFAQAYAPLLSLMHELHEGVARHQLPAQLMLLEHEAVITITRQHAMRSIKTNEALIAKDNIALHVADRGGDATFHGPGQLVGYPLLKVRDAESAIRGIEAAIFNALRSLGLKNIHLQKGFSGIWHKERRAGKIELKKLVAIGIGLKDGVTKHGFALNIDIDHQSFGKHIIPCGLKDRGVTTLKDAFSQESLPKPHYLAIVHAVAQSIAQTFSLTLSWSDDAFLDSTKGAYFHG